MRGLIGLRGQSMSGRRDLTQATQLARMINTRQGGALKLDEEYIADIFAWGAGGTGGSSASTYGGGGGAAGYSRLLLPRGSVLSWSSSQPTVGGDVGNTSGNTGVATNITVNDVTMTAQGGRAGSTSPAGQAIATGFQVNRYGGGTGQNGEFGGFIDSGGGVQYAGGGAGGFRDIFPGFTGGSGWRGITDNGAFYIPDVGGGGGANSNGSQYATWGGAGSVLILLYRYV